MPENIKYFAKFENLFQGQNDTRKAFFTKNGDKN